MTVGHIRSRPLELPRAEIAAGDGLSAPRRENLGGDPRDADGLDGASRSSRRAPHEPEPYKPHRESSPGRVLLHDTSFDPSSDRYRHFLPNSLAS